MLGNTSMRFILTVGLVIFFTAAQPFFAQQRKRSTAPPRPAAAKKLTDDQKRRQDTFLQVITILSENFYDPNYSRNYWTQVSKEYQPRVTAARNDAEFHGILGEMIAKVNVSHLVIIPPEVFRVIQSARIQSKAQEAQTAGEKSDDASAGAEDEAADDAGSRFGPGIELRFIDGQFLVSSFLRDSAAERAGLKPGYVLERVNGVVLADLVRRINISSKNPAPLLRSLPQEIVEWFLNGEKDTSVKLTIVDDKGERREVDVNRERLPLEWINISPNLPERPFYFESRSLNDKIGYVRFNYFALPVIERFCDTITKFKDKQAMILDLRGNNGGVLATMTGLAGMLSDKPLSLGTAAYKNSAEELASRPVAKIFKGRLIVLVDEQSISAAEIFAAALGENRRAVIVGGVTAGAALPSLSANLPTGAVLQYPIANFRTPAGNYLEGSGLKPDVVVKLDRGSLIEKGDVQLETAVSLAVSPDFDEKLSKKVLNRVPLDPPPVAKRTTNASDPLPPAPPPPAKKTETAEAVTASSTENYLDEKALGIISDFISTIGGKDAVAGLKDYRLAGVTEISIRGARNVFDIEIFRKKNGNYSEILSSNAAGEIREVYAGGRHFMQTDYGMLKDMPYFEEVTDTDLLAPIRMLADQKFFKNLEYGGTFTREGRKVHLLSGTTAKGMLVAMTFDVQTKMLTNFTGSYYGLNFDDYRSVNGTVKLPFSIERERLMFIAVTEFGLNETMPESAFQQKINCYDKAD